MHAFSAVSLPPRSVDLQNKRAGEDEELISRDAARRVHLRS